MDFNTSAHTSTTPERNDNQSPSSNPVEMMLVAQLQTRLAVMETELQHAQKARQETQAGTQVLLRLLGGNTMSPSTTHHTEHDASTAQSSTALHKQFQLVVKECERLRKKCRRLRVRNKIERTMDFMKFKQRLSALGALRTESSNTDEMTGSGITLITPNDDIMQEEPTFQYDEPHDSVLDEGECDGEMGLEEMLDDVDTSAPWRESFDGDVLQKGQLDPIQHRHHKIPSVRATPDAACLDDPVISANGHVKTLEDAQQEMQATQAPAAHQGKGHEFIARHV